MVCVAVAGLCDTVTLHCAPPAFRVSVTVPSLTRLRPGFPSDAVTVTVVSPRPPAVGEMPNPLPVVVSVHGPVAVTVNAAADPAVLRSTASSCELVISAGSRSFSQPAKTASASSRANVRRIICTYGV